MRSAQPPLLLLTQANGFSDRHILTIWRLLPQDVLSHRAGWCTASGAVRFNAHQASWNRRGQETRICAIRPHSGLALLNDGRRRKIVAMWPPYEWDRMAIRPTLAVFSVVMGFICGPQRLTEAADDTARSWKNLHTVTHERLYILGRAARYVHFWKDSDCGIQFRTVYSC